MKMPLPPPLDDVWSLVNAENWKDRSFSRNKAYVCAIFSELAYWHIPAFELGTHDNVKVVPSSAYQELQRRLVVDDFFVRQLRERELLVTVLDRRFAIVVIVKTPSVIFVAIRGTAYLYDWFVNAKFFKRAGRGGGGRFHRGFYNAAYDFCSDLTIEVAKYGTDIPVYLTGHSLGGAMAAIVHGTWDWCPHCRAAHDGWAWSHSAYTFGMPRYADSHGVQNYRCPYHIMKVDDIVPQVPPRWLGYADSRTEYEVLGRQLKPTLTRAVSAFPVWIGRLATKTAITQHFVEGYRTALSPSHDA